MTLRRVFIGCVCALGILSALGFAALSPVLQWRDPIYVIAGFAGIIGLALLLVQGVLISGLLTQGPARRAHMWVGVTLVIAVFIHVAGLWVTSPPDVIDVLLFRSPTPFAIWGVFAMWAVFIAALLAAFRTRMSRRIWRTSHTTAVIVVVIGTVVHAWLIQGAMESMTKAMLSALVLGAGIFALRKHRVWRLLR